MDDNNEKDINKKIDDLSAKVDYLFKDINERLDGIVDSNGDLITYKDISEMLVQGVDYLKDGDRFFFGGVEATDWNATSLGNMATFINDKLNATFNDIYSKINSIITSDSTIDYQRALHGSRVFRHRIGDGTLSYLDLYIPFLGGTIFENQLSDLKYKTDIEFATGSTFSGGALTMPNYDGYTPTMSTALSISATRDHGLPALTGSVTKAVSDSPGPSGVFTTGAGAAGFASGSTVFKELNFDSSRQIRVSESNKIQVPNVNQYYCVYLAPYMFKPVSGSNIYKLNNILFRLPIIAGSPVGKSSAMIQQ